jgi:hypothetical protein
MIYTTQIPNTMIPNADMNLTNFCAFLNNIVDSNHMWVV